MLRSTFGSCFPSFLSCFHRPWLAVFYLAFLLISPFVPLWSVPLPPSHTVALALFLCLLSLLPAFCMCVCVCAHSWLCFSLWLTETVVHCCPVYWHPWIGDVANFTLPLEIGSDNYGEASTVSLSELYLINSCEFLIQTIWVQQVLYHLLYVENSWTFCTEISMQHAEKLYRFCTQQISLQICQSCSVKLHRKV